MPDLLTGNATEGNRSAATSQLWIRGGGFWPDKDAHMEWLCRALGATEVMPIATMNAEPFCLTIAKVAHAFAVAELGTESFEPILGDLIRCKDLSDRANFLGGGKGNEPASTQLHNVDFDAATSITPDIVCVKVRLFGVLEAPTYHVAVGRRR